MDDARMGREERSIGELFGDLSREISTLVRQEITLAKTEVSQKASRIGKEAGSVVAGGLVAYIGLQAIVAAIILALVAVGLAPWIAALLIGLLVAGGGAGLAWKGIQQLRKVDPVPRQTVETIQEDTRWAKEQMG